ncbi:MAG: cell division protein FtsZ [Candidatus Thermoplasmatota archaeon]|nr:cell division protein FtsZ [Candidatus Thermoplasmatota archaeon]
MVPIVDELLAGAEKRVPPPPTPQFDGDDEELIKLVQSLKLRIKIVGCGGGGCNTINRLIESDIADTDIIAVNTDASHLLQIRATKKVLLGRYITRGLGAGARPEIGEEAAKESDQQLRDALDHPHITIVTAGLGGGTGTGSAPYVAKLAKETGSLVIAIVTLPFSAEGGMRMENARKGLEKLKRVCDTTIVVPNDKLLELAPKLPINEAFMMADVILMHAIRGITDAITKPAMVNLDFNDLKTIMKDSGMALVGIGESDTPDRRAEEAVLEALNSPLIDNMDFSTARGAMVRVVGGQNMSIQEAQKVAEMVNERTSPDTRIIWGCDVDPTLEDEIRVMVILTGIREGGPKPAKAVKIPKRSYDNPQANTPRPSAPPRPQVEEDNLGLDFIK